MNGGSRLSRVAHNLEWRRRRWEEQCEEGVLIQCIPCNSKDMVRMTCSAMRMVSFLLGIYHAVQSEREDADAKGNDSCPTPIVGPLLVLQFPSATLNQ